MLMNILIHMDIFCPLIVEKQITENFKIRYLVLYIFFKVALDKMASHY